MFRILFAFLILSVLPCRVASAEGALLEKAVSKQAGAALSKALCQPGSFSQSFLKSIDGFSIAAGYTFEGFFDASCEMTFWRQPKTTAKMTTQTYCTPSVVVSSSPPTFNATILIFYGCGHDPDHYSGYSVSAGVCGFRHSWGVGNRVFDEAAAFLGLVKMAKGSGGQSFGETVKQFRAAQSELQKQMKQLETNPLAKMALKNLPGTHNTFDGERTSADLVGQFLAKNQAFLKTIDQLIPKMELLRDRVKSVAALPPSAQKTEIQKALVAEAMAIQGLLDETRLELSPYVLPLYTASSHDGMVLKTDAKQAFGPRDPPFLFSEEKNLLLKLSKESFKADPFTLLPPRQPYAEGVYVDKMTGKHVGNLWGVPAKGPPRSLLGQFKGNDLDLPFVTPSYGGKAYGGEENQAILDARVGSKFGGPFSSKASAHSIAEYHKATASYRDALDQAVRAIEAARGFSFMNDYQTSAMKQGKTPDFDHKVGAIAKSKWFDGCNSIEVPLDNLPSLIAQLPKALQAASISGPPSAAANLGNPKSPIPSTPAAAGSAKTYMPEVGGNIAYTYMVGPRGQITTPPVIRGILDALNSCRGNQVAQGPPNDDDLIAHGALPPLTPGLRPHEPDLTR